MTAEPARDVKNAPDDCNWKHVVEHDVKVGRRLGHRQRESSAVHDHLDDGACYDIGSDGEAA